MQPVTMYTTEICPYCQRAKALLRERGVHDFEEIVVDGKSDVRTRMTELTGRTSVPQIFIGDLHVGGCDDLHALDARGGLVPLLQA